MRNIIGISTGSLYRFAHDMDTAVSMLRRTGTDSIELLPASIDELSHEISETNVSYLRSLDYVSIHAPFNRTGREPLYYDDDATTREVLRKLSVLTEKVNARHIIIHPNLVNDWNMIAGSGLPFCVENMPLKRNLPIPFFHRLLKAYPRITLMLDTAHALSWGEGFMESFIKEFHDRIVQVHLSDRRRVGEKEKSHQTFSGCNDPSRFEKVGELDCPLILELSMKEDQDPIHTLTRDLSTTHAFFNREGE